MEQHTDQNFKASGSPILVTRHVKVRQKEYDRKSTLRADRTPRVGKVGITVLNSDLDAYLNLISHGGLGKII